MKEELIGNPIRDNYMYYTYILQSKKDNKWYTGATDDLRKRLMEHNKNEVQSTKSRGPFEIIYYEACKDRHDAFIREKYLKSGQGKKFLKNRIKRFLSLTGQDKKRVHPVRSQSSMILTSNGGFATLEILIAFAVLVLCIGAVILLAFGNQSIAVDSETNNEALYKAQKMLEDARANSRNDFNSVLPFSRTETSGGLIYNKKLGVNDLTQCKKEATSTVSWLSGSRLQKIELSTFLSDIAGTLALGGDCATEPPRGGWNPPVLFARDTISPGKFNTLDALQKIVYLGSDKIPYLFIADTRSAMFDDRRDQQLIFPNSHTDYDNSFNSDGETIDQINDIDAYKDAFSGKTYAFVAMASTTAPFVVIDVTDIHNPVIAKNSINVLAKRILSGIDPLTSSYPQGWRIYYYNKRVYILTRETAGPEFHVFNVSDPTNPMEMGSGYELTTTVSDFVVRDGIAYLAAGADVIHGELMVLDVSTPTSISEITGASVNLTGDENGESVFLIGNKLYFGRYKTSSGPEFYIFNASNPKTAVGGLPIFGLNDPKKEMSRDITDIRVVGRFAFLASYSSSSGGFDVWDISDPLNIKSVNLDFNFGNKPTVIDYESDFVYAASESTPNFQVLCSGPIIAGKCQ